MLDVAEDRNPLIKQSSPAQNPPADLDDFGEEYKSEDELEDMLS